MTYHDEAIAKSIAEKVERFVRDEILPYEKDRRLGNHGPSEELVREIRDKAVKAAPDEGNMFLLGQAGSAVQKKTFLEPIVSGTERSAFFMTEPASEGGAGGQSGNHYG